MSSYQLAMQFPDDGFPVVDLPADKWVHTYSYPEKEGSIFLRQQIDSWSPRIRGSDAGSGVGDPVTCKTEAEYRVKIWQLVTFWTMAGMVVRPSLDLELLTERESITLWLPKVKEHYSRMGIAPFLAGIKRISERSTRSRPPERQGPGGSTTGSDPSADLPADRVELLRDMTRPEEAASCCQIWEVPSEIDKLAYVPRLRPADRDSRKSSAVAAEILLCTLSFAPEYLASINLDEDVRRVDGGREIRCVSHRGRSQWRPLSVKACERIDDLRVFRRDLGRESSWLFPKRGGNEPQTRQVAMTRFAQNVSAVLRRRFKIVDFRDALLTNGADNGVNDPKILADVAGVKVRTIERRLSIAFKAPLPPSEVAAE